MSSMVFVNLPVQNLARSVSFYTHLGFKLNPDFSDDHAASMAWDDHFVIMLLTHDFYQRFIGDKAIANTQTHSAALISFLMDSAEGVKAFGQKAVEHGGSVYRIDSGVSEDVMFGLEVCDPDGNILEPTWMKPFEIVDAGASI